MDNFRSKQQLVLLHLILVLQEQLLMGGFQNKPGMSGLSPCLVRISISFPMDYSIKGNSKRIQLAFKIHFHFYRTPELPKRSTPPVPKKSLPVPPVKRVPYGEIPKQKVHVDMKPLDPEEPGGLLSFQVSFRIEIIEAIP